MRAACASAVRLHRALSVGFLALFLTTINSHAQTDPLPSWNDGAAKQRIVDFVRATTDKASPHFVPPDARIATFDQDGTLWVEHPIYTQVAYCLDRVPAVVAKKSGTRRAISKCSNTHRVEVAPG
jgi:hypothetical protein